MMWVWDNPKDKLKLKVIYIMDSGLYSVITLNNDWTVHYKHCAEIEEPKKRRMTNQELAWWLREKPTRECKYSEAGDDDDLVYSTHTYLESDANKEVNAHVHIREYNNEWQEPLIEVEE